MKCTCPKCRANIELDLPEVTEEGTSALCPVCRAQFSVQRESFGGRALRKSGEISCAACGIELGPEMHCPTCGAPFPDYLVAGTGSKRVRKNATKIKIKSSPFQKNDKVTSQLPTLDMAMRQGNLAASKKQNIASERFPRKLVIFASVVVLLALITAGAGIYFKKRAETTYTKNFALATYGIQVGADSSRMICLKIASDWKTRIDAGQSFTPHPGVEDEKKLHSIKNKVDSVQSKLSEEPKKFLDCNQKLAKLEGAYSKLSSLALLPGNSLPAFTDSVNKLDGEYKQAAREFKAGIPEEMMVELRLAALKYRGLRTLLQ